MLHVKQAGPPVKHLLCTLFMVISVASCSIYSVTMPNALQSPGTYSAGKGEVGARSYLWLPEGGDVKIGLSDHIQLSGIITSQGPNVQVYEGGLLFNARNSNNKGSGTYLTVFAFGSGVDRGTGVNSGSYSLKDYKSSSFISGNAFYLYEGWYPGFKFGEHFGITIPMRVYELSGDYQYTTTSSGSTATTTTTAPLNITTCAFVPELDLDVEWTHIGLNVGWSIPLQFYESNSPVLLWMLPDLSAGLYYKW